MPYASQIPLVGHSRENGNPVASFLDSCLRRNDTVAPLTRGCHWHRRPLPPGERRTGFLLSQE